MPKEPVATFHMIGDKIMWRGIKLTVTETKSDGSLVATSQTMTVHVSSPEQFTKWSPLGCNSFEE